MGKELLQWTYHTNILVVSVTDSNPMVIWVFFPSQKQINGSSDSHYLFSLCSQPRHHSWQFRRWNWEGSCLSEFFSVCCWFFQLVLGNKTSMTVFINIIFSLDKATMWCCSVIRVKKEQIRADDSGKNIPSVVYYFVILWSDSKWMKVVKHSVKHIEDTSQ